MLDPALAPEIPDDAAIGRRDSGDVAATLLVKRGCPRHQTEAQSVVDHGEAAGGEIEASRVGACHMLADGRSPVWHPTLAGEFGACSIEFTLPQRREQIAREDDTLAVAARQPLLHQVIGPRVHRRAGLRTETAKRYPRVPLLHP